MNNGGCRSLIHLNKYRGRGRMSAAGIHMHHCTTGVKLISVLKSDIQGWHVPKEENLNKLKKRALKGKKKADTEGNTKETHVFKLKQTKRGSQHRRKHEHVRYLFFKSLIHHCYCQGANFLCLHTLTQCIWW